jgi:NADH-ubiquinone oxidoreductase chain 2
LLISLCLSLIIGTVGGLVQIRIKRLLAYSAISHVGFVFLGLVINKIGSLQAFMFYLIQYSLSNANIFFIILVIGYYLKESVKLLYKESENSPLQFTNQLKGYSNINPLMSLSLAISIFSLAGKRYACSM